MRLPDRYQDLDSDEEDSEMAIELPTIAENPFDGVTCYGDGLLDAGGNEILLSAGEIPLDRFADIIWKAFEDLEYYDHTVFADKTALDSAEDSTVTGITATMAGMGMSSRSPLSFY